MWGLNMVNQFEMVTGYLFTDKFRVLYYIELAIYVYALYQIKDMFQFFKALSIEWIAVCLITIMLLNQMNMTFLKLQLSKILRKLEKPKGGLI